MNTLKTGVVLELNSDEQAAVCRLAQAACVDTECFLRAAATAGVKQAIRAGEEPLRRATCAREGKIDWKAVSL